MRTWHFALSVIVLAAIGCSSNSGNKPKELTQQEMARKQWNMARAAVLYKLAKEQYATGNLNDCRKTLDDAYRMAPDNLAVRLLSARVSIEMGKLEAAETELQQIRAADPTNHEADYLSGVIYQRWQRPQTALDFYTKACEKAPAELPYLMARIEMMVLLDHHKEALELLQEKVTYFENSPAIRDAVGELLMHAGRYGEASHVLRQASILAPDDLQIREHLILAMVFNKEYREAGALLEKLMSQERYAKRKDLMTALGECQLQTHRPREARESFETAAQLQPSSVPAWINLGKAALELNDLRRADLSVRKALSLAPDSADVHVLLGYVKLREESLSEALTAFKKASILDPADSLSLCMCGYVLEKLHRPAEAIAYYGKALKVKPKDELASSLMAQISDQ